MAGSAFFLLQQHNTGGGPDGMGTGDRQAGSQFELIHDMTYAIHSWTVGNSVVDDCCLVGMVVHVDEVSDD